MSASRITIKNRTDATEEEVLRMVLRVVREGRVSGGGKVYCYGTSFGNGFIVLSSRTRIGTDQFLVTEDVQR